MDEAITIRVPRDVREALDRLAAQEGRSRSAVVQEALRGFLFVRRFRDLRNNMMSQFQAGGAVREEDVFREVS